MSKHIWDQKDRELPMQQARRDVIAWLAQVRVAYDIIDDIEPYLSKALPAGLCDIVKDLCAAHMRVADVLGCLDYFLARCEELSMTPEQARAAWERQQPDKFLETMREWQSYGPNEINLVDEFILKPMGLPPCPETQASEEERGD